MLECIMFYVILFSALAVLLVVAGLTATQRRRSRWAQEEAHDSAKSAKARRQTKAQRAQSRQDRRHRH
jgi:hypothetical protein